MCILIRLHRSSEELDLYRAHASYVHPIGTVTLQRVKRSATEASGKTFSTEAAQPDRPIPATKKFESRKTGRPDQLHTIDRA